MAECAWRVGNSGSTRIQGVDSYLLDEIDSDSRIDNIDSTKEKRFSKKIHPGKLDKEVFFPWYVVLLKLVAYSRDDCTKPECILCNTLH